MCQAVIVQIPRENYKWLTYLSKDFYETPILDIRFLIGGENEDLPTVGADCNKTAIVIPAETLDSRQDSVRNGGLFLFL